MTTHPLTPTEPAAPVGRVIAEPPRRRGSSLRQSRRRLIIGLVTPAVVLMVLVHLLPMLGGFYLSFKNLNTFTFAHLFDAPWAGLDNYQSILFEADNPLRSGFTGAVGNTSATRSGPCSARSAAGSPWRCCSTGRCAASRSCAR